MVRDPTVNRAVREHHAGSSPALPVFSSDPFACGENPASQGARQGRAGQIFQSGGLTTPRQRAFGAAPFVLRCLASILIRRLLRCLV
jgi:hypothetical protein